MAGMLELAYALQMRDTVNKLVTEALDRLRPKYRYATVVSFDRPAYKCTIIYNGETNPVIVNMGAVQPNAAGQTVRIEGIGIDKYITDVVGGTYVDQHLLNLDDRIGIYKAASYTEQQALVSSVGATVSKPLIVERRDLARGSRLRLTEDGFIWQSISTAPIFPTWLAPTFQNSWTNYGSGLDPAGYFKTSAGIVAIMGLIRNGTSNLPAFTLPVGYRPDKKIMFICMADPGTAPSTVARVDVYPTGEVWMSGTGTGWTSLNGIMFPAADPARVWTNVIYENGWLSYDTSGDTSWGGIQYWKDALGRVWFQGLARRVGALPAAYSVMFTLPEGYRPSEYIHTIGNASNGFLSMDIQSDGKVGWKPGTAAVNYISVCSAAFPAAGAITWEDITGYLTGWIKYPGGFAAPSYGICEDGIVFLRGLYTSGTGGLMINVPAGRRAGSGIVGINIVNSNNTPARINLGVSGNVDIQPPYSSSWVSHDGVKFIVGG